MCVYYCIQYLSQIWNLQPFGLQNRHAHEAKHVASGIIVHEKEIGGLCLKKEDAMMVTQYVRKKYQMEPTLIPEKRLFLHQGTRCFFCLFTFRTLSCLDFQMRRVCYMSPQVTVS